VSDVSDFVSYDGRFWANHRDGRFPKHIEIKRFMARIFATVRLPAASTETVACELPQVTAFFVS
jgi:hypothetical protein